jgi:hypothetical protein
MLGLLPAVLLSLTTSTIPQASALADPIVPPRQQSLVVDYTGYTWWLLEWGSNEVVCSLTVDHEGVPTHPEVRQNCGEEVYQSWLATEPCDSSVQDPTECRGLYLHLQGSAAASRTVIVDLPQPTVHIGLAGCSSDPPDSLCKGQPVLVLTGVEPLPNESIVRIRGSLAGVTFSCPSDRCEIPVRSTAEAGTDLVFWADSSFGDSTEHFTALVRAIPLEPGPGMEHGGYVDVLSSQWTGPAPASCSAVWDALPPPGGPPGWLRTPATPDQLTSDEPYTLLAGLLISHGLAAADSCPNGGLLGTGAASPCGLEATRNYVVTWQNRFDQLIVSSAQSTGAPAQLIKNIFAIESQFWPGNHQEGEEVGLGHLTEKGADTVLLWSSGFFNQFCPLVLEAGVCAKGYAHLLPGEQAMLRGALALKANAQCQDCPIGIDLTRADFSVGIFAETLLANCEQVGRMVQNTSGERPGQVVGFEDLWRFTLANYNAGPGCLTLALKAAWGQTRTLTWQSVSARFSPACQHTLAYVKRVSQVSPDDLPPG